MGCSIESGLVIVVLVVPEIVEVAHPFMNSQVMKGHISSHFLFDRIRICLVINAILQAQSLQLLVVSEALLGFFWKGVSKIFNLLNNFRDISRTSLRQIVQDLSNKHNGFMVCCIITALNDGFWIREFILLEDSIQALLKDFCICDFRHGVVAQDFMGILGSIVANIIVLATFPLVIQISEPLVDGKVVEGDVGDDFLFDFG